MAIVYQHRRKDTNEVFYVGIGKDLKRAYSKRSRSKPWRDTTKNHEYQVEILFEELTWEQACEIEIKLISELGRRDLGEGSLVNLTSGGDGVPNLSEEVRKKMAVNTGKFGEQNYFYGKKHSGDLKRFGVQNVGKTPWMKGKTHSKESVEKMKKSQIGRIPSDETKRKLGDAIRGKRLGENHPMYGKPSSQRKKLQHVETGLIFEYAGKAAEYFKVSPSVITKKIKDGEFKILN